MSVRITVALAVFVSAASCAVLGNSSEWVKPLRRCCFPRQSSAVMFDLNSVSSDAIIYMDMQTDYDVQKQVMLNFTRGSKTPVSKVLIDYNKKTLYYVATNNPNYCFKTPVDLPLFRCIPDDAQYLGSSYLGPMGAGHLPYDGWRVEYPGIVITLAISQESCVPLLQSIFMPALNQKQLYLFSSFRPSLVNPDAFNLPDSCK